MRWRGFCEELIEGAHALEIELVATLGALLADTPHTRPVPVSGSGGDPATAAQMNVEPSRYEGPTGIVGVFGEACQNAGLPAVSFWAAVPHYVAQPPCPKATLALLSRIEDVLDVTIPLGDLPERSRAWERQVDELAAGDSDVAEYVRSLESREPETELPEASGDAIAREFERLLAAAAERLSREAAGASRLERDAEQRIGRRTWPGRAPLHRSDLRPAHRPAHASNAARAPGASRSSARQARTRARRPGPVPARHWPRPPAASAASRAAASSSASPVHSQSAR